ncbi:hypothetical protein [Georgenia muralis]
MTDAIELIAAVAALGAVLIAVFEYSRGRKERREGAEAELDGVAVAWHPRTRPNKAEPDGAANWEYIIMVNNPGMLPIRDVRVLLRFPVHVRRLHYDGTLDEPQLTLELRQPVIIGGGTRTWRRHLRIPFADAQHLHRTTADVVFTPLRGRPRTNHMDGRPPTIDQVSAERDAR